MRSDRRLGSVFRLKMIIQRIHACDVIRMNMRQHDLANSASARNQFVNSFSQRQLFVFIRRSRIDHQNLTRRVNQITVGMRRGRLGRRAQWKTNVVRPEFDFPRRLRCASVSGKKSLDEVISQPVRQESQRMQHRRRGKNLVSLPLLCARAAEPLAAFQFTLASTWAALALAGSNEKETMCRPASAQTAVSPNAQQGEVIPSNFRP